MNWLDRAIGFVAPQTGLRRTRARLAAQAIARHYEGAASGRRTQGWRQNTADVNASTGPALARLRDVARDLVRNNPYAESALSTISDHVVGTGIVAKPKTKNKKAADLWERWACSTDCDSDGQLDFYGIQKMVTRTMAEAGEVIVRRRLRRPEDDLPIPLQLQVLDPDYLDTAKTDLKLNSGGARIINGVEFDALGRRVAYWLFKEHPGSAFGNVTSVRVPAESVLHIFKPSRPGQVRGPSWFAQVLLRFKDFDEFEDATLMKQKVAACLAVIVGDPDGSAMALGTGDTTQTPQIDSLEPGMIMNAPAGRTVTVVDPPSVREYSDFTKTTLRAIATGLGVTYEDLTGDYAGMPFSAARMSRLRHWARVEDWRWRVIIPKLCDPVWEWAMQAAGIMGLRDAPDAEWTAPPAPMVDPTNEGRAYMQNIRTGIQTWSEAVRERGYDPEAVAAEMAADNKRFDDLGLVLDCDARKTSQAGLTQARPAGTVNPSPEVFDDGEPVPPAAPPPAPTSEPKPPNGEAEAEA